MDGNMLQLVISASGLPAEQLEPWLQAQLEMRGLNPYEPSLDDLRELLADILQSLILEAS